MGKRIKGYIVCTSRLYRLILFLLLPVVVIGQQVGLSVMYRYLEGWERDPNEIVRIANFSMCAMAMIMLAVEIVIDSLAFGGIAAKGGKSPEYLKSSKRGKQLTRVALQTNLFRQFLENGVVLFLGRASWSIAAGSSVELFGIRNLIFSLAVLFCQYFAMVIALMVTRRYNSFQVNLTIASIAYFISVLLFFLCGRYGIVMFVSAVLLSVAAGIFSQYVTMKRVEESYYDQKPKTGC